MRGRIALAGLLRLAVAAAAALAAVAIHKSNETVAQHDVAASLARLARIAMRFRLSHGTREDHTGFERPR